MKSFDSICKMTQNGVKEYMNSYLMSKGYQPICEDGFLYARGTVPVLLVAHMDTVHRELCKEIVREDGKISSPQGIGGDDRCGIYIIMNIVKELNCSVLLCEDEEIGGVGAKKFTKTPYIKSLDVNYMLEFDRRGNNDAVYYSCDNKEFKAFIESSSSFKETFGSFSDISSLMPVANLAAVNLSSGYYNAHATNEYVVYDEMMDTVEEAKSIIKAKCEKPFVYVAKQYKKDYSYDNYKYDDYKYDYDRNQLSMFDKPKKTFKYESDIELELEVIYTDADFNEQCDVVYGMTKSECWFKFFMAHTDVCMENVSDFSWT